MQKLFNKILVPVDFSSKSKKAVERACDLARRYNCSIHLVHVQNIPPATAIAMAEGHMAIPFDLADNADDLKKKLDNICRMARILNDDALRITYSINRGTWDEVIIDYVMDHKFDLVIVGQKGKLIKKHTMLINPDKIAAKTNIPVVTLPSNKTLTQLLSIVIPITDFLPVRKLMYGVYMASGFKSTIRLLGIVNDHTRDKVAYYLEKASSVIRENCNVKVQVDQTNGDNVAAAVNAFARHEQVDLVILNPGLQTKMPGFFSGWFGRIIQKYSSLPVLTVNPV